MDVEYFRTLFDYGYWARDRLFEVCAGLSNEEYGRPTAFTYPSLRRALTHTLSAEAIWCARFRGEDAPEITEADVPTLASLEDRWASEESKLRDFLAGLSEDSLSADLSYRRRNGVEMRTPLWALLLQVTTHGIQHRSEVAEMLTQAGHSPGDLDFTIFFWSTKST